MKINSLEVENVKRIKAVKLEPTKNGLTIIGGKNGQGKTSVLDAIVWALGGERFKPSVPKREGALVPPSIHIEMDNGIIVERKGANSTLKVIDSTGKKSGQKLLNEFISQLALNLPAFMEASDKEKADTLLKIIGVGDQLNQLDQAEKKLYFQRTEIGRFRDMKDKAAKNMPSFPNMPKQPVSASELIRQQQAILLQNSKNQEMRNHLERMKDDEVVAAHQVERLRKELEDWQNKQITLHENIETAQKTVDELKDESTAELEANIANIEEINRKIRANAGKKAAEAEADDYAAQYDTLTTQIEDVRTKRANLLNGAKLPLPGLSVEEGKLTYNGLPWDGMSSSEQLKVATAIVKELNPQCGFVLMDKLEQMDMDTLQEFGDWLKDQGLQVIATRVSTGNECSVIIEDGMVKDDTQAFMPPTPKFTAGSF